MNTFVTPSHLSVSKTATTALDSQESLQGGNASRVKRAEEFVKARKAVPLKGQTQPTVRETNQKNILGSIQAIKPAAEQVDAKELSTSVSLKGGDRKSKKFSTELNKKILSALVPSTNGMHEILYSSVRDQLNSKENLKTKVEILFKNDKEMQSLVNVTILEILATESEGKGFSKEELTAINRKRDEIYSIYGDYIEIKRESIIAGASYSGINRMSVRQGVKMYQIMDSRKEKILHGFLPFIKIIAASTSGNARNYLLQQRKNISAILHKERVSHDSQITKQRSHLLQSRLSFINHAIQMIDDYSDMLKLIRQ